MTSKSQRAEAAVILGRVLRGGGYSNVLIANAGRNLDAQDRAMLRALVFGALRPLGAIDKFIAEVSSRPMDRIQPEVLDVIRIGVGELLHGSTGAYAAVSEAVETVRSIGKPRAAGFVNATLRRIAETISTTETDDGGTPDLGLPGWMFPALEQSLGHDEARDFIAASQTAPPIGIRIRPGTTLEVGTTIDGIPDARLIDAETLAEITPLVDAGEVVISDPASTAVAHAVAAEAGHIVLDAAASPGGKTSALWDAMGGNGRLVAADRHPRRLDRMRKRMARMGVAPTYIGADAAAPPFREGTFDRILLDAPCTGLGTWRRRPEIPYRLEPGDPARLGEMQASMIESLLPLLRPEGRLVYSVCTVFAEETIHVVDRFKASAPEGLPGRTWGSGHLLAPHVTGTDGMFVAVITR